jgi:hypothetical protein
MKVFAVCVIGFLLVIIIGANLFYRHKRAELVHQERMAAIERGVEFPIDTTSRPPMEPIRRYLLSGMIWLFSGAALVVFLGALSATLPHRGTGLAEETVARIDELRKLGADDSELRRVLYDQNRRYPEIPLGLSMVGLIPMGVGLAYLIFFFTERKRAA